MLDHVQIPARKPLVHLYGDGIQCEFLFDFPIFSVDDLLVWIDGRRQDSGYEVRGINQTAGGSVLFARPPALKSRITLHRQLKLERTSDFPADAVIRAKAMNDEFDYQAACLQQVQEQLDRCVKTELTEEIKARLTLPSPKAGAGLGWSADGTALVNDPADFAGTVAAVKRYANAAKASEVAAETSANHAEDGAQRSKIEAEKANLSKIAAADSESMAHKWANNSKDAEVKKGEFSAYHWAKESEKFARNLPIATNDSLGAVRGSDNVAIAVDGTLSVPDVIDMMARGFGKKNLVSLSTTSTPPNDFDQLWDVDRIVALNSTGQLNGPGLGPGAMICYGTNSNYRVQLFLSYTGRMALRSRANGILHDWVEIGSRDHIGEIRLMPFRAADLPKGWHVCNGGGFATTSVQGKALAALPANFKADWTITISGSTIYKPNLLKGGAVSGQGPFFRPSSSNPGTLVQDAIRNITGSFRGRSASNSSSIYHGSYGGAFYGSGTTEAWYNVAGSHGSPNVPNAVGFSASNVVPTAAENRPFHVTVTPAIWLGV